MKCPKCGFEDFKDTDTICRGCGESIYNIKNNTTIKDTIEILEINNDKLINAGKIIPSENKNIEQMKNIDKNNLNKKINNNTSKENNQTNIKNEISKSNNSKSKKLSTAMLFISSVILLIIVNYQLSVISSESYIENRYGAASGGIGYLINLPAQLFLICIEMLIIIAWISYALWHIIPVIDKIIKKIITAIINYYKKSSLTEKKILLIILFVIMVQLATIIFFLLKKYNIKFEDVVSYIIGFIIGFIIEFIKQILPL